MNIRFTYPYSCPRTNQEFIYGSTHILTFCNFTYVCAMCCIHTSFWLLHWLSKSSYRKKLGSKFVQLVCMRENFDLLCCRRRIYFAELSASQLLPQPNAKKGLLNNHHFRNFFGRNSSMNFCVSSQTSRSSSTCRNHK